MSRKKRGRGGGDGGDAAGPDLVEGEARADGDRWHLQMTVEGERDDICGLGQTEAAHDLCANLPPQLHYHYVQPGVGHYGIFNGRRWRTEILPRVAEFMAAN